MVKRTPRRPRLKRPAMPGAGRPFVYGEPLIAGSVRLIAADWEELRRIGGGSPSAGIRGLLHGASDAPRVEQEQK